MIEAINRGLREEMERNPKIVMWGEDIADPKGGVFGVTRGLSTLYPDRVQNSPLAEASIAGVAGGMAIAGYKPIVEIQFADYAWPAFMQMRNEIPTIRWRSNGVWKESHGGSHCLRRPHQGRSVSFLLPGDVLCAHAGLVHLFSQQCAEDAKGSHQDRGALRRSRDFPRTQTALSAHHREVAEPECRLPDSIWKGEDQTGKGMRRLSSRGARPFIRRLEIADEFDLEVIDLRTIVPMDDEIVFNSVRKDQSCVWCFMRIR